MAAPDLTLVQQRIKDICQVLGDFKTRREDGRPRTDYLNQFRKDLCLYYSYNDYLMEKLMELFPQEVSWLCCLGLLQIHLQLFLCPRKNWETTGVLDSFKRSWV
jgi:hypothetical protein